MKRLITLGIDRPDWVRYAACRGADTAIFYPGRGESPEAAIAYCNRCPVRELCLDYADSFKDTFGVWGGTTGNDRRRIRSEHYHRSREAALPDMTVYKSA